MKQVVLFSLVFFVSAAEAFSQDISELWRFSPMEKITYETALPSGDLIVSTERSTMLLSGNDGQIKWKRDDLIECAKASPRGGFLKVRISGGPFVTCQLNGKWERMSFWGPYIRLESGIPDGTPGGILFQRCGFLQSCLEAGSLAGAPKAAIGGGFERTHEEERLVLVNLDTGQNVFDSAAVGIKNVNGTCLISSDTTLILWEERDKRPALAAAFEVFTGKTLWTAEIPLSKDISCLPLGNSGLWLAYGKSERGERRVFGIESTGRTRWESRELAKEEWGDSPVAISDTDSTAVLHIDEGGPLKINLQTGAIQWRAKVFRGENPAGDGRGKNPRPQPIVPYGDRIFIAQKSNLAALDKDSGNVIWQSDFKGPVVVLLESVPGLLVRQYQGDGDSTLLLLSYDTGKPKWSRFIESRQTGWLLQNDSFFYITDKKLNALSLETGQVRVLGSVPFVDGESPTDVELLDNDALLVVSSQNVAVFERSGSRRYESHYAAPGLSLSEKLLRIAVASAASAVSKYAARMGAQSAANTAAFMRGGSASVWYSYKLYNPQINERLPATKTANQFLYMYTEQPEDAAGKRFTIVQLDKTSGKETARLAMKERRPNFFPHPNLSMLFVKTSETEITAFGPGQ